MEIWKDVLGYEGLYQVSNLGRFRSSDGTLRSVTREPRNGYCRVSVRKDGKKKSLYIHSLVLEAFVGPRPTGMDCCHNNDDKADNRLCNLRWDSRANNLADRKRNGRLSSSYKVRVCRPAMYKVSAGRSGPMYKGRNGEVGTEGASPAVENR